MELNLELEILLIKKLIFRKYIQGMIVKNGTIIMVRKKI